MSENENRDDAPIKRGAVPTNIVPPRVMTVGDGPREEAGLKPTNVVPPRPKEKK